MLSITLLFRKYYIYFCALFVDIYMFGGGLNFTWTSPVFPKLEKNDNPIGYAITSEEESWIGSLLMCGAIFGPFIWGYLADKIGRKYTLILINVPFGTAFLILAFAQRIELYYLGRFIGGLSLGGMFFISSTYFIEVSEAKIRGGLSSSQNLAVTLSTIVAYAIGPYLSILAFSIVCFIFPIAFIIICFFFIKETPYYLTKTGRLAEAEESLMMYRGASNFKEIADELNQIKFNANNTNDSVSLKEVFANKATVKGVLISLALMVFQQCSGINAILANTQTIFIETKSSIPSDTSAIIVGVVAFIFACISATLVDKLGRRLLILIGSIGMFISELCLGIYFYLLDSGNNVDDIFWLPILSLLMYIGFFYLGFGALPWVILAEVLPNNVKNKLSPIVASFCWILSFLTTKLYANIADSLHLYGVFWLFTGFNAFSIAFAIFLLPETKEKSIEEIQRMLS